MPQAVIGGQYTYLFFARDQNWYAATGFSLVHQVWSAVIFKRDVCEAPVGGDHRPLSGA